MPYTTSVFRNTPYYLSYIYNGQMFHIQHTYTINPAATVYLQVNTDEHLFHTVARIEKFSGGGPILAELLEDPAVTDGATLPNLVANLDRRSAKTPSVDIFIDPTNIVGGTLADKDTITATTGVGINAAGSLSAPSFERVLKPNTKYVLRYTNQGATASTLHMTIIFYETPD